MNEENLIEAIGINKDFTFNGLKFHVSNTEMMFHYGNQYLFDEFVRIQTNDFIPRLMTVTLDIQFEPNKENVNDKY